MVSFVCNYCQATLKKPKLDQHAQRCYNATFSCIDCNTDFVDDAYRQHTACMTEEQKYKNKMAAKNTKKPAAIAASAVPKSTVDQLKEKQSQATSDVAPTETATKKRKHEKSDESATSAKEEKKSKDKSAKGQAVSGWDDSALPATPAGALTSAITFVCKNEPGVAFADLKKKCVKMVTKHPKCTFSKSDVKDEFAAAVLAALSEGNVTLTKC
ncbi:hypothetical protein GGH94_004493 [Coemansia aciculifera]|uniref:Zinc finger C2H2 LYAR-type domain-containing protein n=1 Tax=Coemansia aciculifera TaxID=417176 RepID=A0A9W8M572_9FUNG|nr:hypothetical protein GGH94_004493 [Coemansia aciculifera]